MHQSFKQEWVQTFSGRRENDIWGTMNLTPGTEWANTKAHKQTNIRGTCIGGGKRDQPDPV